MRKIFTENEPRCMLQQAPRNERESRNSWDDGGSRSHSISTSGEIEDEGRIDGKKREGRIGYNNEVDTWFTYNCEDEEKLGSFEKQSFSLISDRINSVNISGNCDVSVEMNNKKSLFIYYQDVRGIKMVLDSIYNNILVSHYSFFISTESWLKPEVKSSEIVPHELFEVYRADRTDGYESKGGGVIIIVRSNIVSRKIGAFSTLNDNYMMIEIIGVNIYNENCKKLNLIGVYIPPDIGVDLYLQFIEDLTDIIDNLEDEVALIGDFNCPAFDNDLINNKGAKYKALVELMSLCNLNQYNKIINNKGNLLDLVFSSSQVGVDLPTDVLTRIDKAHPPLQVIFINQSKVRSKYKDNNKINSKEIGSKLDNNNIADNADINTDINNDNNNDSERIIKTLNINKFDKELMIYSLTFVNWERMLQLQNVNDVTEEYYNLITKVFMQVFIPYKKNKGKKKNNYPQWFDSRIINNIQYKDILWNNY